jgi:hypothetical protein
MKGNEDKTKPTPAVTDHKPGDKIFIAGFGWF